VGLLGHNVFGRRFGHRSVKATSGDLLWGKANVAR